MVAVLPGGGWVAADLDVDPVRRRRGVGIVARGKGGDLEPVTPMDPGLARPERVGRGEAAAPGDVLLHPIGGLRVADADPESNVDPAGGQIAAEQLALDLDRLPPGDAAGRDALELDLRAHDHLDLTRYGRLGRRTAAVGGFDDPGRP